METVMQTRKTGWTIAELMDADLPETPWIVPDLLPVGLTILGGRPKVGKSWLLLQLACAVGCGGRIFDRKIEPGKVLYLALEDSTRRLKDRALKMNIPRNADIDIMQEWRSFYKSPGIDALEAEIENGGYKVILLDTISRLMPGVDQGDAEVVGPIFAKLQKLTMDYGVAIVCADHLRKPSGYNSDPIDDVLESTAKTAIADQTLALYREKGKAGATLKGRGRDVEEIDLRITFDRGTYCWQAENSTMPDPATPKGRILAYLAATGAATASAIAKDLGVDYQNNHGRLQDLEAAGLIIRDGYMYRLADKDGE